MTTTTWRVMTLAISMFLVFAGGCDKHAEDKQAIRAALEANRQAIIARDADGFIKSMSESSLEWFERMLRMARTASRTDVQALPLIERGFIIAMRNRVPKAELRKFDARGFIRWSIDLGWWDDDEAQNARIRSIRVLASTATVRMYSPTLEETYDVGLVKEDDTWKIYIVDENRSWDRKFREWFAKSPIDENRLILQIETFVSGREARDDLWDPPK